MIQVFIELTEDGGKQTTIPGGPFATSKDAHNALHDYGVQKFGTYRDFVNKIDAYGFRVDGFGSVRTPT